jgi:hypothetical protein
MAALREIAALRRTSQGLLSAGLWDADTSLLFDAGRKASTSISCSPRTCSYTSSLYSITSKLSLVPYRGTVQRVGCCLHFARVLLAPSFYKHNLLQSDGRTHALGMTPILPCGFIAQQCLVLASLRLTVLFIAKTGPRAVGEVMTLSPCGLEILQTCACLKVMTLPCLATSLSLSASMMPEPPIASHGYSALLDSWAVCHFLGGKRISDHC